MGLNHILVVSLSLALLVLTVYMVITEADGIAVRVSVDRFVGEVNHYTPPPLTCSRESEACVAIS